MSIIAPLKKQEKNENEQSEAKKNMRMENARDRHSSAGGDRRPTHFPHIALGVDTRDVHQGRERGRKKQGGRKWVTTVG